MSGIKRKAVPSLGNSVVSTIHAAESNTVKSTNVSANPTKVSVNSTKLSPPAPTRSSPVLDANIKLLLSQTLATKSLVEKEIKSFKNTLEKTLDGIQQHVETIKRSVVKGMKKGDSGVLFDDKNDPKGNSVPLQVNDQRVEHDKAKVDSFNFATKDDASKTNESKTDETKPVETEILKEAFDVTKRSPTKRPPLPAIPIESPTLIETSADENFSKEFDKTPDTTLVEEMKIGEVIQEKDMGEMKIGEMIQEKEMGEMKIEEMKIQEKDDLFDLEKDMMSIFNSFGI